MNHNALNLGRTIPVLIAFCAGADFVTRFLPAETYAFRAWEAATRYSYKLGPFTPSLCYDNPQAHGDLPSIGNHLEFRTFHPEVFTTDENGFRINGASGRKGPVEVLLLGDSFGAGSGQSDEQTLTANLERLSGRRVFNGAVMRADAGRITTLVEQLSMTKGIVILEWLERAPLPEKSSMEFKGIKNLKSLSWRKRQVETIWKGFWMVTPLEVWARRIWRQMQNDRVLPNPVKEKIQIETLKNGQRMLFYKVDVGNFRNVRPETGESLALLRNHLRSRGLDFLVVLVPDKYHIYYPWLSNPPGFQSGPTHLDQVEHTLSEENIHVLNLTPSLSKAAAEAYARGEVIYWPDDTHWTPEGARVAAEAINNVLPKMLFKAHT